jgi:hypothetical protein
MPEIHPIYVFDVALGIDLDQAERTLRGAARQVFRHRGRVTNVFHYRPAPLRLSQEGPAPAIDRWKVEGVVDLVLYDFGAVSVDYLVPIAGDLAEVQAASAALRRSEVLRQDAKARAETLLKSVGPAAQKPRVADFSEDYTIIGLRQVSGVASAQAFCDANRERIAQILRPDPGGLSAEEIVNATELRISFGPSDVTIVDWDAAFVLDPEPEDVVAVLEFANVQLLEMRWLDLQLDDAIERSYQVLSRSRGWRSLLSRGMSGALREVAELQLDSAVMLERVSNALKVFGEEYLARIYRLATRRFQLADLDAAISRKVSTIESIYQKLSDRAASVRMEALEWIVIALIALEIVLGIVK